MSMQTFNSETVAPFNKRSISKVDRYGWSVKDAPGKFMLISKSRLKVDFEYQRDNILKNKVRQICSDWSWLGCGCILVAMRPDGTFWVFDGQHRVAAAMRRSDIDLLPCMAFECDDRKDEAKGFLVANAERKPVTALDKFKALVMTGDQTAVLVANVLCRLNIEITNHPIAARQIKCVSKCMTIAKKDPQAFEWALKYTIELCGDYPIHRDILDGLFWIEKRHVLSKDKAFSAALQKATRSDILDSIAKYSAAEGKRGERVCALGVLKVVNRGRRNRFGEESR